MRPPLRRFVFSLFLCAGLSGFRSASAQEGLVRPCQSFDEAPPASRSPVVQLLYPDLRAAVSAFTLVAFRVSGPLGSGGRVFLIDADGTATRLRLLASDHVSGFSYFHAFLPALAPAGRYRLVFVPVDDGSACTWYAPIPFAVFLTRS